MSPLDKFVFNFCKLLEKEHIKYVVVSGYVAIVFGRSRIRFSKKGEFIPNFEFKFIKDDKI